MDNQNSTGTLSRPATDDIWRDIYHVTTEARGCLRGQVGRHCAVRPGGLCPAAARLLPCSCVVAITDYQLVSFVPNFVSSVTVTTVMRSGQGQRALLGWH